MMSVYMYRIYRFTMEVHVMKNYVMFDRNIAYFMFYLKYCIKMLLCISSTVYKCAKRSNCLLLLLIYC